MSNGTGGFFTGALIGGCVVFAFMTLGPLVMGGGPMRCQFENIGATYLIDSADLHKPGAMIVARGLGPDGGTHMFRKAAIFACESP